MEIRCNIRGNTLACCWLCLMAHTLVGLVHDLNRSTLFHLLYMLYITYNMNNHSFWLSIPRLFNFFVCIHFLAAIFALLVPSFDHRGRFNSRQLAKPSIIIHQWFCPSETFLSATKINCHVNCGQFSKSPAVNVSAGKEFLTPEAWGDICVASGHNFGSSGRVEIP